ncbi:MAG: hypothetical protein WBC04_24355 [Candidatus Acidiferrales bacterium]
MRKIRTWDRDVCAGRDRRYDCGGDCPGQLNDESGLSRAAFRGRELNEYLLTRKKGSIWEVKSDSVNLGEHVGHTVTITGAVSDPKMHGMKEDAKEEAKEQGMAKNAAEHGHMTVTNLKMVSDNCQN